VILSFLPTCAASLLSLAGVAWVSHSAGRDRAEVWATVLIGLLAQYEILIEAGRMMLSLAA
jgi:hypothetical protein